MIDIESRLADLGAALDLDETDDLVAAVLARLPDPTEGASVDAADRIERRSARFAGSHWAWTRAAAVVALLVAAVLLVVPASRAAVADWFGLDGVVVEREPGLSVPATAPPMGGERGRDGGTVVDVGRTDVLVEAFDLGAWEGRLDEALVSKTLGAGTGIRRVDVAGDMGLWIDGAPHVVSYRSGDGSLVSEQVAGDTLLWQDGSVIRRVEGFQSLREALAFATSLDRTIEPGGDEQAPAPPAGSPDE